MKNSEFSEIMRARTKKFALSILHLQEKLPNNPVGWVIGKQIIRSSTSVAANYRATTRARSRREFYAKLCIVVEEADETCFWLEMIIDAKVLPEKVIEPILNEAIAITKIFSSSRKKIKTSN